MSVLVRYLPTFMHTVMLHSSFPTLFRARCTYMCWDPHDALWCHQVLCRLHRRRMPRQSGIPLRLRLRAHHTHAHGCRMAQQGCPCTHSDRTWGTPEWPCLPNISPNCNHWAGFNAGSEGACIDARGCGECAGGCGAATTGDDHNWVGCDGVWTEGWGGDTRKCWGWCEGTRAVFSTDMSNSARAC